MPAHDMNADLSSLSDRVVNAAIGAEFRKARESLGLYRHELAERLPFSVTDSTLLNWELANRSISYKRLIQSAPTLGTTAPDILKGAMERIGGDPLLGIAVDFHPRCIDVAQSAELALLANELRTGLDALLERLAHP